MATYKDRFTWLADSRTNGDRGVAFAKDFGGRGLSYWPTEYGGRPLPGMAMKAFKSPEDAVDAALAQTPDDRKDAEKKEAEARAEWARRSKK